MLHTKFGKRRLPQKPNSNERMHQLATTTALTMFSGVIMSLSDHNISRRKLVGTLGAGLAAAAIPSAVQAQTEPASTAQPMSDPTTKYPKPPYTSPFQPWPGLASKMTPPPDHGETSYKGSGRLLNRKALITGGRLRHGARCRNRLCARRCRRCDQLFSDRRAGCSAGSRAYPQSRTQSSSDPWRLTRRRILQSLVAKAASGLGGLDIIVSNAGRQHQIESILDMTTELFDWTMKDQSLRSLLDDSRCVASP